MTVPQLNEILARELHRAPGSSDGIYKWEWSEDLFWPSYATGRMVPKRIEVPLIGGGVDHTEIIVPEYRRDRMSHKLRDQWVITKWCAPETLDRWEQNFPGAPYPADGFRINTDWYNPPGVLPSEEDTIRLIWALRNQSDKNRAQLTNEMEEESAKNQRAIENEVEDEINDSFGAFLNPKPGSRSGHVSMPYTEIDRKEALPHG